MNNISDNDELLYLCESNNLSLDALQQIINTLRPHERVLSQNPSWTCFHLACRNENVTLEIVQLLHNTWPGALRLRDDAGWNPIHWLCCNEDLDETVAADILLFMVEIDPTLSRELVGDGGYLPVHLAVQYKSTIKIFCKILIDAYPESLRIESGDGLLPIHQACEGKRDDTADTTDTIQYMLELDSELINAENSEGYLPIHCAAMNGKTESIELMLKFDPDSASKENNNVHRQLPLHLACVHDTNGSNLSSIQVLYDAYPEAIFARDEYGDTPLDDARSNRNQQAISTNTTCICPLGAIYDSHDNN